MGFSECPLQPRTHPVSKTGMQDLTACVAWMGSCPHPAASWPLTLKAAGQRASGKEAPALPHFDQNFTRSDTPGTEQALGRRRIQNACLPSEVPGFPGRQKWPGGQEVKVSGTSRDGSGRCRGELAVCCGGRR